MRRPRASIGGGMFAVLLVAVDLAVLRELVSGPPKADNDEIEFVAAHLPLANLAAVLGYDLWRNGPGRLRRIGRPLTVVAGSLYAPFVLVLLFRWPDSKEVHPTYLQALPVLPGFLIQQWSWRFAFEYRRCPHLLPCSGLATTLLLVGLTRLGARGRGRLVAAGALASLVATPTALLAYTLFHP